MTATRIPKEQLPSLHLTTQEVLTDENERLRRRLNLQKATWLGNTHKHKVTICFQAQEQSFLVETTIWTVTDTHVGLKGGITLPVTGIYWVDLC